MKALNRLTIINCLMLVATFTMIACGGSKTNVIANVISHLSLHTHPRGSLIPSTKNQSVSQLDFSLTPKAFAATIPSTLPESFEADCDFSASNTHPPGVGAHTQFGNTGFVPLSIPNVTLCSSVSGTTSLLQGVPVTFDGTLQTFVAYADTKNGARIRCNDLVSQNAITDNTPVLPYVDLSNNSLVMVDSTTFTPLTMNCSLPLASGDDILRIVLRWTKV